MVAFFLSQRSYAIGKVQGLREIAETKNPLEPGDTVQLRERPIRDLWFQLLDIRLSYSRRITAAGRAFFIS